jgi:vacuolar-type H+-ATPase subunit I/STV1
MDESISGFKERGDWGDVVEHGERITLALREAGADGDAFHEFDDWRPKSHERIDEDVSEKTAAQASVGEGNGEKAGQSPGDDLQTAGEKLTESYEKVEADDTEGAVERWGESINHVARAADSASRKALRKVEDAVYQKVMTQVAPYYFDNELISANVTEVSRGENGETFEFEVNVNDDDLKSKVSEILAEYESEIDRWHVETEKRTEDVAAAEGVEPPEEEGGPESTMT